MPRYYEVRFPTQILKVPTTDEIMSSVAKREAAMKLSNQVTEFIHENILLYEVEVDADNNPVGDPELVSEDT